MNHEPLDTIWNVEIFSERTCIVITDEKVKKIYKKLFAKTKFPIITIKNREAKSLKNLGRVSKKLLHLNVARDSVLISIGGGSISDFAGFLASIYKRGIDHVIVPTTLLGMVDASIGGKTGIDMANTKNILGTFYSPTTVIIHQEFLKSLPEKEFKNGLAEIIKIAAISDKKLFKFIEQNCKKILIRDPEILNKLIIQSIENKERITKRDTYDKGKRILLNYGHTIGHALEKSNSLSHGEAVAIGMHRENIYSQMKGITKMADASRIEKLLLRFNFQLDIKYDRKKTYQKIKNDKKNQAASLQLPVVSKIGKGNIILLSLNEIKRLLA